MLPQNLVFLDTETTGLYPRKDRIIEVGLIRIENGQEVARYQTLINPQTIINPFISDITNIMPYELENAPLFEDIARPLSEYLDGAVLVAHNARFDYAFLKNEFFRAGKKYSTKALCTAKLSRYLFPKYRHHNLDSIIDRFAISVANRHRAFDDAHAILEFYEKLQKTIDNEKLHKAVQYVMKHPSLPSHLMQHEIDVIPESPGVYIFYGDENIPLYVGKSVNVKDRVKSHFANDHRENKEMNLSRLVKRIETIATAGELGALLKEAELIKSMQPIYNKKLRASRRLIVLQEVKKDNDYTRVAMEELTEINPSQTATIITTCKSKKQAQEYLHALAEEHNLCKKLLGIEKIGSNSKQKTSCFGYRLGKCKGACVGKENMLSYNARCIIAFSKYKMKPWPFDGPIVIREENIFDKTTDEFLVDKWCLLGKKSTNEYVDGVFSEKDYRFDMDTYKILVRFVEHAKDTSITQVKKKASQEIFSSDFL